MMLEPRGYASKQGGQSVPQRVPLENGEFCQGRGIPAIVAGAAAGRFLGGRLLPSPPYEDAVVGFGVGAAGVIASKSS